MRKLKRSIALSGLVLGLMAGVPLLDLPGVAQTVAQNNASELDSAIAEGMRLFQEGSADSLRKAIVQFEKALQLSRTAKSPDKQALSLGFLSYIYSVLGEKQKALEYYNQALPLFRGMGDRDGEATTLNNIGGVYADLGEKQKALEYYNQALPLYRAVRDRSGEAGTLNNIGGVHADLGEKQKALEYYNQALPLYRDRAVRDRSGEARTLNNIGRVYADLGEKRKALEYYNQALPLKRAVRDRIGEAGTLNNIGAVHADLGEKRKALEYYNQALPLFREVGDRSGEATTLNNIGTVYDALGEKQKALEYYNQALPLKRAVGDRSGEADTLNNIGTVYNALGEKRKALEYYNQALPLKQIVGDRSGEATTLNNIGAVYADLSEKQKALEYYNQALPLYRAVGDRTGEAATLNNVGGVYNALGEKQKALEYYNQALPLRRAVRDLSGEAITLNNIGFVLANQKQSQIAIAIFKQSVNVYESIRKDNQTLPQALRESYTKSISSTYQALADLLIKQGRLPEAQAVLELLKLKELNTYTRDLKAPSNGISFTPAEQKALTEVFSQYTTAANFAQQISTCAETNCPTLTQLQRQRDQVNTAIREMLDRLRITLKNQTIDLSKLNTLEFTEAAANIVNAQPGTVLIYPIITDTKIQFLLAFKAGAGDQAPVTFRAIDGDTVNSEDIFQATNQLRNALSDPTSDLKTLQAASQKLYNWLIKPLEPEINQPQIKHLVFATDRTTRQLPLAALYDGKDYLINKPYTISTILAAKTTEPNTPKPNAPNVLAVGASQFKNANPLPYVEQEISAIVQTPQNQQGIFPGNPYLNAQFSFDNLKQHLTGHNILHIATHGNLDPVNIDNSYLLTSSGEQIDKTKIQLLQDYGLKNVHLVILSACDTGTGGKNTDGLEIAGISYYFMKGGAKAVIASLWKVNDPGTALFMQQFYKHLKTGMTKAEAIQQVQRDFSQGKLTAKNAPTRAATLIVVSPKVSDRPTTTSYAHPYYWAPFILIGNNL